VATGGSADRSALKVSIVLRKLQDPQQTQKNQQIIKENPRMRQLAETKRQLAEVHQLAAAQTSVR
jgi:hypothetical protein